MRPSSPTCRESECEGGGGESAGTNGHHASMYDVDNRPFFCLVPLCGATGAVSNGRCKTSASEKKAIRSRGEPQSRATVAARVMLASSYVTSFNFSTFEFSYMTSSFRGQAVPRHLVRPLKSLLFPDSCTGIALAPR